MMILQKNLCFLIKFPFPRICFALRFVRSLRNMLVETELVNIDKKCHQSISLRGLKYPKLGEVIDIYRYIEMNLL